jgi:hypothetical protein
MVLVFCHWFDCCSLRFCNWLFTKMQVCISWGQCLHISSVRKVLGRYEFAFQKALRTALVINAACFGPETKSKYDIYEVVYCSQLSSTAEII